jgi:hypothetical protein
MWLFSTAIILKEKNFFRKYFYLISCRTELVDMLPRYSLPAGRQASATMGEKYLFIFKCDNYNWCAS